MVLAEPEEAAVQADSQEPEQAVPAEPEEGVMQVWDYFPDACSGSDAVAPEPAPAYSPMAAVEVPMDGCSAVQPVAAPTDAYPAVGFQGLPDEAVPGDWFPELLAVAFRSAALLLQDDYFPAAEHCDCFPPPDDFLVAQVEARFRVCPDAEPGLAAQHRVDCFPERLVLAHWRYFQERLVVELHSAALLHPGGCFRDFLAVERYDCSPVGQAAELR